MILKDNDASSNKDRSTEEVGLTTWIRMIGYTSCNRKRRVADCSRIKGLVCKFCYCKYSWGALSSLVCYLKDGSSSFNFSNGCSALHAGTYDWDEIGMRKASPKGTSALGDISKFQFELFDSSTWSTATLQLPSWQIQRMFSILPVDIVMMSWCHDYWHIAKGLCQRRTTSSFRRRFWRRGSHKKGPVRSVLWLQRRNEVCRRLPRETSNGGCDDDNHQHPRLDFGQCCRTVNHLSGLMQPPLLEMSIQWLYASCAWTNFNREE